MVMTQRSSPRFYALLSLVTYEIWLKPRAGLALDLFSVPDPNFQDDRLIVLNLAYDPEIAQPVWP